MIAPMISGDLQFCLNKPQHQTSFTYTENQSWSTFCNSPWNSTDNKRIWQNATQKEILRYNSVTVL